MHTFTLMFLFNYMVFDMFRTSKCSSSGILVHAVLWHFFPQKCILLVLITYLKILYYIQLLHIEINLEQFLRFYNAKIAYIRGRGMLNSCLTSWSCSENASVETAHRVGGEICL